MVPAPLEQAHVEDRRVGHLEEADAVAGHAVEHLRPVAVRQHVEGVDRQRDGEVVGPLHRLPGLADALHVPAPGQRLVGDPDAVLGRQLAETVQLLGGQVEVVDGVGRGVGARQHHARRRARQPRPAWRGTGAGRRRSAPAGTPSTSRTGWKSSTVRPRSAHRGGHLAGRQRRGDEVVVEHLDAVEAGTRRWPRACRCSTPLSETVAIDLRSSGQLREVPAVIRSASGARPVK